MSDIKGIDSCTIRDILSRSLNLEVLSLKEVDALMKIDDPGLWEEVFDTAQKVKEKVYGKRVVLFAPLYLSNHCINNCVYCGFRRGNLNAKRAVLSIDEAVEEACMLSKRGYKRLLLVTGESPVISGIDYLEDVIDGIYKNSDIRILHLNAPPMSVDDFKRLKARGIGVYQCFQETYHLPTYRAMHPSGPKADYEWRITVMDRAIEGGFEDIGMGVLLGLYDWRWDVSALIAHARRLINKYGFGPHTISVPRLQPAEGSPLKRPPYPVSDEDLKKIVAIYRLALPYVGIVVSTREPAWLRDELLLLGVSQISAGSRTSPHGYIRDEETEQFEIGDKRSMEEVIDRIVSMGLLPSLCTACYREGRSGERFKSLSEAGAINRFCYENALLTLKEYIEDYTEGERKEFLSRFLIHEASKAGNGLFKRFKEIERGRRDIHI